MWDSTQQNYFPGYISPNQYQEIPSSSINYKSSIPIDSLDWPFLDNIDPALCSTKEYRHILREISRTFVRSTIVNLGSAERTIKLLRILQIIISILSSKIDEISDENRDLRNKYRILHKKYEIAKKKPRKVQNIIADRCPICQDPFKTIQYLDLHVFSKHKEVSTLWQAIRTPQPPGAFAFPWQKSHSISATVYPQSTQNLNDQSVQNFLDDFRKKFSNEKKESDKQMKEWIDKKMTKVESKIDTLQQTAKKEIDNLKIGDHYNQKKNRNHHRKKNKNDKNQQNEFDTQNPFNPPNQKQQQVFQNQQPQQQTIQNQPQQTIQNQPQQIIQNQQQQNIQNQPQQIIQNQSQQIIQNQPQQTIQQPQQQIIQNQQQQIFQNQPIHKEEEESVQQIKVYDNNDDENDHQKSAHNSESGSIISLGQTSNANFESPKPKDFASGSDAEYFTPPSYDDFSNDQNLIQTPTKKQISGSQNSTSSHISGVIEDFNRSQNSDINPKRNASFNRSQNSDINVNKNTDNIPKQNSDFNRSQYSGEISQQNSGIIQKINSGIDNVQNSGEISQQNSELEVMPNNKVDAQFYRKQDKYSYSYSYNDEENKNNFEISYVQPQPNNEEDNEDEFYVKSDDSDPYKEQLNKFNSSEIIRAEPPPGRSLLRHSSSVEETIPQIKRNEITNNRKEIDNDYSFYSEENNIKRFNELSNSQNYDDDDNEFIEKLDDGVIGSGFSMDSMPHSDLPELSDSQSGKQQPQKFRNYNYKRNTNQQ